jgi:flavorubredoxin
MKEKALRIFLKYAVKLTTPRKLRKWQYRFFRATQVLKEVLNMNNALIIYFSKTGNTEKVAFAIKRGLEKAGLKVTVKKVNEATEEELYDYDLVCFGSPVLHSLPPPPVFKFIRKNEKQYKKVGEVNLSSPKVLNKNAIIFCTYSGPHCGINEAIPVGKYIRQFFEHLGFDIKGEWYEVGEFHGWETGSTKGRLGDIRGRPNAEDLALVELRTTQLVRSL